MAPVVPIQLCTDNIPVSVTVGVEDADGTLWFNNYYSPSISFYKNNTMTYVDLTDEDFSGSGFARDSAGFDSSRNVPTIKPKIDWIYYNVVIYTKTNR